MTAEESGVPGRSGRARAVRRDLQLISAALVAVTGVMLAAGTVVTGTGPLAGHADTPRYKLPLEGATQLHADIGWLLAGLAVALVLGLRLSGAPPRAVRAGWIMLAALGPQGVIGYLQYFTHLPAGLVWVHVTGSVLVWIAVLRLYFAVRERSPRPCHLSRWRPHPIDSRRSWTDRLGSVSTQANLDWTATDERAVDLIRVLAMDSVQKAGSGHPGTAMSLAPAAYLLFQRLLRHDPADPNWPGRDRFVLSCGHSSLTLYIQLYLSGYGLTLDDLKGYRTWGSITPGHPEHGLTPGVETTTGPLGQGIGNAVGMAMAARRERGLFDPDAEPGQSPFDHFIYCFVSDGDIEEGISHEVSSLAGHHELGNLIVLYDDNRISIEDNTKIAKSEDVCARYEAYGWHVQKVSWRTPDGYHEDVQALYQAFLTAREHTEAPSFIALSTIIGWPAPNKKDTGAAHGSALGVPEVQATKKILHFDPEVDFPVEDEALSHARQVAERGKKPARGVGGPFAAWASANPDRKALFDRMAARRLPDGWTEKLPSFPADAKGMATRKASGAILTALAPALPELWGGSADLAESNLTTMEGEPSFIPEDHQTAMWPGNPYGRTMHFGIREHGMGAILNGIALSGGTRPYGGTFLVFSDYMRGSVRLAALMELPVTYVWTHDSIGLGEDGPTHQPIEHVWALRAIPGLEVVRPGTRTRP